MWSYFLLVDPPEVIVPHGLPILVATSMSDLCLMHFIGTLGLSPIDMGPPLPILCLQTSGVTISSFVSALFSE